MMQTEVVECIEVVPNIYKLTIVAPEIAQKVLPGQFVIVIKDEDSERIPFTVADWQPDKGYITIYFLELGISTHKLTNLKSGDILYGVAGPLGKPATIERVGTVVLGGGCFGIGAIYPLAKAFKTVGNRVYTIIEARSKYLLFLENELKSVSDKLLVATVDGSSGSNGDDLQKVQDVVKLLITQNEKIDLAYFIGCTFMMMRCAETTRPYNIKTLVSLSPIMVDGTGMCGCCRVTVGGVTKFACVDGPEFDGHQVDWQELFQRQTVYVREEAYEAYLYQW